MTADAAKLMTFVGTEIETELASQDGYRKENRRNAFFSSVSQTGLAALISVLLGLQVGDAASVWMKNLALVLGVLATLIGAVDAFFRHRELWVSADLTVRELEDLKADHAFHLLHDPDLAVATELHQRFLTVRRADTTRWRTMRAAPAPDRDADGAVAG